MYASRLSKCQPGHFEYGENIRTHHLNFSPHFGLALSRYARLRAGQIRHGLSVAVSEEMTLHEGGEPTDAPSPEPITELVIESPPASEEDEDVCTGGCTEDVSDGCTQLIWESAIVEVSSGAENETMDMEPLSDRTSGSLTISPLEVAEASDGACVGGCNSGAGRVRVREVFENCCSSVVNVSTSMSVSTLCARIGI